MAYAQRAAVVGAVALPYAKQIRKKVQEYVVEAGQEYFGPGIRDTANRAREYVADSFESSYKRLFGPAVQAKAPLRRNINQRVQAGITKKQRGQSVIPLQPNQQETTPLQPNEKDFWSQEDGRQGQYEGAKKSDAVDDKSSEKEKEGRVTFSGKEMDTKAGSQFIRERTGTKRYTNRRRRDKYIGQREFERYVLKLEDREVKQMHFSLSPGPVLALNGFNLNRVGGTIVQGDNSNMIMGLQIKMLKIHLGFDFWVTNPKRYDNDDYRKYTVRLIVLQWKENHDEDYYTGFLPDFLVDYTDINSTLNQTGAWSCLYDVVSDQKFSLDTDKLLTQTVDIYLDQKNIRPDVTYVPDSTTSTLLNAGKNELVTVLFHKKMYDIGTFSTSPEIYYIQREEITYYNV